MGFINTNIWLFEVSEHLVHGAPSFSSEPNHLPKAYPWTESILPSLQAQHSSLAQMCNSRSLVLCKRTEGSLQMCRQTDARRFSSKGEATPSSARPLGLQKPSTRLAHHHAFTGSSSRIAQQSLTDNNAVTAIRQIITCVKGFGGWVLVNRS